MKTTRSQLLLKVANVLDVMADREEKRASQQAAAKVASREQIIAPVLDKLSMVSGDSLEDLRSKLSNVNEDALTLLSKVAGSDSPIEMGGPGTEKSASALSRTEKGTRADAEFTSWVLS